MEAGLGRVVCSMMGKALGGTVGRSGGWGRQGRWRRGAGLTRESLSFELVVGVASWS